MLLPQGNMAKFSKLVFGLVLILAVLEPVVNLVSLNPITIETPAFPVLALNRKLTRLPLDFAQPETKPLLSASSREMEELAAQPSRFGECTGGGRATGQGWYHS